MILIAGGTGRLGAAIVERLVARDAHVRVLSRDPSRAHVQGNVEVVVGNVRIASSLRAALTGAETVVSAVTGFGPGGDGPRAVDQQGNFNLITEAQAAGVKRFVLVSIHGARTAHPMELYRAKFAAEQRLRESALDWTIIRPTVFLELWAGIVGGSLAKGGVATVFGRGDNPINFVSIQEVARSVELAAVDHRWPREVMDVAGSENLSLNQLVASLAADCGGQAKARHVPLNALRIGAALLRPIRPDLSGLMQAAVQMDVGQMSLDRR
jgi:uncharacterized protein YbjT (DUF2867 family)